MTKAAQSPLGKSTQYVCHYSPELLFAIARSEKRDELEQDLLGFNGQDIWNAYEISWLDEKGLPQVAIGEFRFDADSEFLVESKSFKLYLNSFNQSKFARWQAVEQTMKNDLSKASGKPVEVSLYKLSEQQGFSIDQLEGELLDEQDVKIDDYNYKPQLLEAAASGEKTVSENLISHLLKSNCLITSQPDWASIQIIYLGPKIDRSKLLQYLVSFRSHNEFHEQCVERIFCDLKKYCMPEKLTVYARYTRRGGLDINPWRSDFQTQVNNVRLVRQ